GAGGVGSVGRVNDHAGGDLHGAVDDDRFAGQNLSVDFLEGERWIAAGGRGRAATRRRVDGGNLRVRVIQRPLDPFQLSLLHVQHRVGKVGKRAGVIPVPVADDDLGDVAGLDAQTSEQVGQGRPVHAVRHLVIVLLLPSGVVEDHVL